MGGVTDENMEVDSGMDLPLDADATNILSWVNSDEVFAGLAQNFLHNEGFLDWMNKQGVAQMETSPFDDLPPRSGQRMATTLLNLPGDASRRAGGRSVTRAAVYSKVQELFTKKLTVITT